MSVKMKTTEKCMQMYFTCVCVETESALGASQ